MFRNLKTDYGAVGDGVTDDTPAFLKASSDWTLRNAVLYLPPGTYV
jgi:polygalacturonase